MLIEDVIPNGRETESVRRLLMLDYDPDGLDFVNEHVFEDLDSQNLMATSEPLNVELITQYKTDNIINLKRVNDIRRVNKFFEAVNAKLVEDGNFIGCFESKEQRKQRIFDKFPTLLAYIFYYFLDFPWKRVFPKVTGLQKIYFGLSKGNNRVLSKAEVLGRLVSCGFEIRDYQETNYKTYFCVKKISKPVFDKDPTYGPLVTLNRVGYKGKIIRVYKLRTMHPYSEYLQSFVYKKNGTENGDKFEDDFRITNWGKLLRSLWIDELPMFINYFRGELKIVGVRPLSKHKFDIYPEELQKKRTQVKPGLIPPFYADLPETVEEFYETENRYLDLYSESPIKTDIKYFFKVFYNIFFKGARSQ